MWRASTKVSNSRALDRPTGPLARARLASSAIRDQDMSSAEVRGGPSAVMPPAKLLSPTLTAGCLALSERPCALSSQADDMHCRIKPYMIKVAPQAAPLARRQRRALPYQARPPRVQPPQRNADRDTVAHEVGTALSHLWHESFLLRPARSASPLLGPGTQSEDAGTYLRNRRVTKGFLQALGY